MARLSIPLSVLDLANVPRGGTSAQALQGTTRLAQTADLLGYHRFWVAEHHNMPIVASTSPTVLMAHLAAVTENIHVGSGGIMLPNHPSLVVAEQVAILEALHPGRIDVGIGRAPGTDQRTAAALRRDAGQLAAEEFPQHLIDLMGLLGDVREGSRLHSAFAATPAATSRPEILLLGSSGYSAQLAGVLGLPFVQAHHFDMGGTSESLRMYRERFDPVGDLAEPYPIVTANAVVAEDEETARRNALPGQLFRLWLRTGRPIELLSVEEALEHPDRETAESIPTQALIGDPDMVADGMVALAESTGAAELMVTATVSEYEDRIAGLELLADAVGLSASSAV
ncbi:MAG: MsnO8 family LLM class oxidoreductase [Acidimicrobiia bacterium]|nr:MsnO8 family LLM class oxidoreductase [Acidimicrobiia bacterium]